MNPIKSIYCCNEASFAIDIEGNAYYWGKYYYEYGRKKSHNNPKKMKIKNCAKIKSGHGEMIILDNEGKVFSSKDMKNYIPISLGNKIIDLIKDDGSIFIESQTNVWEINCRKFKLELKPIDYNNYLRSIKIYRKTYHLKREGYFVTKQIQWNSQNENLEIIEKNVFDGKYQTQFDEIKLIGEGGFGEVFEVKRKFNEELFAIKKIKIKKESIRISSIKEIKICSKAKSDYVVKYFDSWIEEITENSRNIEYIYLQMELCQLNLNQIINNINRNIILSNDFLNIRFFISFELFKELTNALNYLHSINIIHRDFRPANVLVSDGRNGVFLKLCDFGLATAHIISSHERNVGTESYMAPEVKEG